MEDKETGAKFSYTYSAPTERERREIEDIRSRYRPEGEPESAFAKIKRLDSLVKKVPSAVAVSIGIVGTLAFGGGMAMTLEWDMLAGGIAVSVVGALFIAAAYPLYKLIFGRLKKKYAPEILKLSEELLHEKN